MISDDSRRSTTVADEAQPNLKGGAFAPRRVIPLKDLARRANVSGSAAEQNQARVAAQLVPIEQKLAPAIISASQLISATIYHCTLAICERLAPQDAPELIQEIDKHNAEHNGSLN
jgi:hypothetical protein